MPFQPYAQLLICSSPVRTFAHLHSDEVYWGALRTLGIHPPSRYPLQNPLTPSCSITEVRPPNTATSSMSISKFLMKTRLPTSHGPSGPSPSTTEPCRTCEGRSDHSAIHLLPANGVPQASLACLSLIISDPSLIPLETTPPTFPSIPRSPPSIPDIAELVISLYHPRQLPYLDPFPHTSLSPSLSILKPSLDSKQPA